MSEAVDITARAKSNLAFALSALPAQRRRDMVRFYAFCRVVDDIADDGTRTLDGRREDLDRWERAVGGAVEGEDPLAAEVREIGERYGIPAERFREIVRGVGMDVEPRRFGTAEEVEEYSYLVASVVGLVSVEIFGYKDPGCREYARALGLALQWTNIIRDVGEDARIGRIYLPQIEMHRFQLTDADIFGQVEDGRFAGLMGWVDARARHWYARAESVLPDVDRKAMRAAEVMREIYKELLQKMRRDGFRVYSRRYRLGGFRKAIILWRGMMG